MARKRALREFDPRRGVLLPQAGDELSEALRTGAGAGPDEFAEDHGLLGGLSDDDHPQYLKERASGGIGTEVPLHVTEHISGGGDPFLTTHFIEAIVKRIRESTGPTDLLVGAIADGDFLKRVGAGIQGASAGGAPTDAEYIVTAAHASLSAEKLLGTDIIMKGTLAGRPAASIAGRLYYITDAGSERWTRDTGLAWEDVGPDWDFVLGKPATFPPSAHASSHRHGGADEVSTATPAANAIPKADALNKLATGWVSEVLAIADLSDITAKTGTGTVVVMQDSPTINTALTLAFLTQGSIPFAGAGGAVTQDNTNLFWDNTNKRIGIGLAIPVHALHIKYNTPFIRLEDTAAGSRTFQLGVNANRLEITDVTATLVRLAINSSGHLLFDTDNAQDIGASGATRPRDIYVGTSVRIGTTPAQSGDIRLANALTIYRRNAGNTADLSIVQDNGSDGLVFGGGAGITLVQSSLAAPGSPVNGQWWVEVTGTTPTRIAAIKVNDAGTVRTIASVTF